MILWATPALASAWTRELGDAYVKSSADFYSTARWVVPGGDAGGGAYLGQQYGLYGEVGVLPGWRGQLTLSLPLVIGTHFAVYTDPFGTDVLRLTSVRTGDLRAAAQVAVHPNLPIALAVDIKVPTYRNGTIGASYPTYLTLFPKPGDGQLDLGASLLVGGTPWRGGFGDVGVGFLHRTEQFVGWDTELRFSDGVRLQGKLGHTSGRWSLVGALDGLVSPGATDVTRSTLSVSAGCGIDVGRGLAVEPRAAAELWTENASKGASAGLGLSWRPTRRRSRPAPRPE